MFALTASLTLLPLSMTSLPADLPADSVEYKAAEYTQSISTLNEQPNLRLVRIRNMPDRKWSRSGGLLNVESSYFSSRKFKRGGVEFKPVYRVTRMPVLNSFGHYQYELGLTRTYPNGARFDDILYNGRGVVFEHRSREKIDNVWRSSIIYRNPNAWPKGYGGLQATCVSCHNQAGTGGYADGLVPGGDTVLSDPMDWSVVHPDLAGYN